MANYRPTMTHYTTMDADKYYELLWGNSGFADAAQVIGCIVDVKNLMLVHMVADGCNTVSLFISKCVLLSIIWNVIIACQKVILEP